MAYRIDLFRFRTREGEKVLGQVFDKIIFQHPKQITPAGWAAGEMKQLCCWFDLMLMAPILFASGCIKVGPNYSSPAVAVSNTWIEAKDSRVTTQPCQYREWWRAFNDPCLDQLIDTAYRENLPLRVAGVRILEARAQLGIAIGEWYPQNQQATGDVTWNCISAHSPALALNQRSGSSQTGGRTVTATHKKTGSGASQTETRSISVQLSNPSTGKSGSTMPPHYAESKLGMTAAWELDFWGKFRRGIESADANLLSTIADYDNALVSLTADTASNYILIQTLKTRLAITRQNVETQRESLKIAQARFHGGTTSQRDVEQAATILANTQALIPSFETQLRQAQNALCVLMGKPPSSLSAILGNSSTIPSPPPEVAIGIPADLLRRRPDIRRAELQAEAQSAQIGVATADLLPAFSLNGTVGFDSSNVGTSSLGDMFERRSFSATGSPSFQWNILNYGQLTNQVRVQDARFQELLITYQNTVLVAQQEVEDSLIAFINSQDRAKFLSESTQAARRSLELAILQYRKGITDFTTVLTAQQALLNEQDALAVSLGDIAQNLVGLYRAMGGGWEYREGKEFVPEEIREEMAKRTDWGNLLKPASYDHTETKKTDMLPPLPDW